MEGDLQILLGDASAQLATLPAECVQVCVTSPPYWRLRDYQVEGQIGQEATPDEFIARLVEVFEGVKRVLKPDGTLWVNMGDSYAGTHGGGQGSTGQRADRTFTARRGSSTIVAGLKEKDLIGQPWMLAFALRSAGWYLRAENIWHKRNPMPESVYDRPTKSHEQIFLLSKKPDYYYDAEAVKEPGSMDTHARLSRKDSRRIEKAREAGEAAGATAGGKSAEATAGVKNNSSFRKSVCLVQPTRNMRDVWTISSQSCGENHFASFPEEIPRRCILAGSRPGDIVLDPFGGTGTTARVALGLARKAILIELNPKYLEMIDRRTTVTMGLPL